MNRNGVNLTQLNGQHRSFYYWTAVPPFAFACL